MLAFGAWLQIPQLLTPASGVVTGATYADVHARMPALWVLVGAALLGAVLALWQAFTAGRLWPIAAAVGLYLVVSVGGSAYAAIIQRFVVAPNEQVRETPFIVHNIQATRAAFGLDGVTERPLSGEAHLTRADLERNAATIDNVPLWNDRPLLDTFSQIQEIRTYYDFVAVDNDRYTINGQYRQIMLSARELNSRSLPSRTWINEHLTFTHGYGLTLGPVNEVTQEGLPVLFIKDLPPVSTVDLKVTQPAIYFGELPNDHVFVKTQDRGVRLPARRRQRVRRVHRQRRRAALERLPAADVRDPVPLDRHVLLAEPDRGEPRDDVPQHRGARRADRAVPQLRSRPVPDDLRRPLVWMQDVYTTSRRYPVLDDDRRRELHPQLDQGDDRRLPRHDDLPRRRSVGSDCADDREGLSRPAEAARGDAGEAADAAALSAADLRDAGGDVRDVPHDQPGGLLQPRGPVGDSVVRRRRQSRRRCTRTTRS